MTPVAAISAAGVRQEPRWLVRRKAEAAATAVRAGGMPADEACHRYGVTPEQFAACQRAADRLRLPLRRFA